MEETKAVLVNDLAVSSTKIRNALSEGDIITANEFLGYHYPVSGTVVAGKKNRKNNWLSNCQYRRRRYKAAS